MRLLFELDRGDHAECSRTYVRNSARSIIFRGGKVAMIHSLKYGYYKFPGGGIEKGEDPIEAMIRETREEAGLLVIPESVREFGYVHRVQKSVSDETERFVQDNYYYLCRVKDESVPQVLDDYEADERFTPEFVDPQTVIDTNRRLIPHLHNPLTLEREARVLETVLREGVGE